jgi:hypothetical protein
MIVTRGAAYIHLGQVASLSRRQWIRVRPGQLPEVPISASSGRWLCCSIPGMRSGCSPRPRRTRRSSQVRRQRTMVSPTRLHPPRPPAPASRPRTARACKSALDPKHLKAVGKQWAKTYHEALGTYKDVRMVSKLGLNGRLAAIGMVDQEGLTIWNDYCSADSGPTGVAAIPTSPGKLTDVKAWLTIDPCLVGTWSMVGPLENYPGHPIANGSTILTILPDGQGTLTFAEIKYPLPSSPGSSWFGVGSVIGTAALTVVAPVALSDVAHRLVWNVVSSYVTETDQGSIIYGSPGYDVPIFDAPPEYVPTVPDEVTPQFSDVLTPDVRQTSYDCNSDHGTLSLEMPFSGWKPFDVMFARTTKALQAVRRMTPGRDGGARPAPG